MYCEECGGSLDLDSDDPCICKIADDILERMALDPT
jgi:hypothetical protein